MLAQKYLGALACGSGGGQSGRSPPNQVIFPRSIFEALTMKAEAFRWAKLDLVMQIDALKYCLDFVISVRPLSLDGQGEVHFCKRSNENCRGNQQATKGKSKESKVKRQCA